MSVTKNSKLCNGVTIKCDKNTAIDLVKCPHILVGGATGSGKSYLMKHILCDVLRSNECKVIVVDPKCVDYQFVNGIGKLEWDKSGELSKEIKELWNCRGKLLLDADDISNYTVLRTLIALVKEMRLRYNYMKSYGYVQWSEYLNTSNLEREGREYMIREEQSYNYYSTMWGDTRLVLFIDELADLIYADRNKRNKYRCMMEECIIKLSTLGRAAGIHLVLGTQRPDATILSGQLRANIPTRIGLKVTNNMERRIILGDSCKDLGERVLFYENEYRELSSKI